PPVPHTQQYPRQKPGGGTSRSSLLARIFCTIILCAVIFCGAIFSFLPSFSHNDLSKHFDTLTADAATAGTGTEDDPYIMTAVADWKTVVSRSSSSNNRTFVKLGANISASGSFSISGVSSGTGNSIYNGALNVPSNKYITLDLQTYRINRGLSRTSSAANGHVMYICSGGNLTIEGATSKTISQCGYITGGNSKSGAGGGGLCIYGTVTMNGGAIYQCYTSFANDPLGTGGGVHVGNGGKFYLNNGYVRDCEVVSAATSAGGVGVAGTSKTAGGGYFEMNGGAVFNCSSSSREGGVASQSPNSKIVINGGEIYGCTCTNATYATALGAWTGSTVIVNGGAIHDNNSSTSKTGALCTGVNGAKMYLNGGAIYNNSCPRGAITARADDADFINYLYIGGGVQIFGNSDIDVYIPANKTLTVNGALNKNGQAAHI
ncbi:MAG: hypothetical protein K2N74_02590, partial [Clostridiales bacterium]|nr:hypothetical protein [Clostridiales bacterium]